MREDPRSNYVGVTAASPFNNFIHVPANSPCSHEVRTTVASIFEVFNGNANNREIFRIVHLSQAVDNIS